MDKIYKSKLTNQDWEIIPSENGYIAVSESLSLSTEGDNMYDVISMIYESEQLLLRELGEEGITITEYMQAINMDRPFSPKVLTQITK